jgi:predicted DNA-binding transcriptional regulator AlpA
LKQDRVISAESYLSVQDLAKRYGVAVQTVYHWNHKGTGPRFTRAGRLPRYRLNDILAWENARMGGGESAR